MIRAGSRATTLIAAAALVWSISGCSPGNDEHRQQLRLAGDVSPSEKAKRPPEPPFLTDSKLAPKPLTSEQQDLLAERAQLFRRVDDLWTGTDHELVKKLLTDELARDRQVFGVDSPYTVATLYQLGKYSRLINDNESSVRYFKEVLRIREMYLGDGAIDTAEALHWVLKGLISLGKLDEAQQLADSYFDKALHAGANESAQTYFDYNKALILKARGNYKAAIDIFQHCADFKANNEVSSRQPPTLLSILQDLAFCQIELGQLQSALRTLESWVAKRYDKPQVEDGDAAKMLVGLAEQFKMNRLDALSMRAATAALQILDNKHRMAPSDEITVRGRLWHLRAPGSS